MLNLSWKNMLLPISVNLCCLDFNHKVSIRTVLLCCILLREICYCLYLRICAVLNQTMRCTIKFADLYKGWKNCWTPICLHYSLYSWWKSEQVFPKRYFLPKRLFQIFFSIHTIPLFLSCRYQHLLFEVIQFLVMHEWPSVFSKQFVSLFLDSVFLTGH